MICPICRKLIENAVKLPCCSTSGCSVCVRTSLIDRGFSCPSCNTGGVLLDAVTPNEELRKAVFEFSNAAAVAQAEVLYRLDSVLMFFYVDSLNIELRSCIDTIVILKLSSSP